MNHRIYLLTGAAGLLGSNVSRQLIEQGEQVRALVLKGDPAMKYIPEEVEIIEGDLLDSVSMERFFTVSEGTEIIVIHCASMVTLNPKPNPKVYAVNVEGTQNIITMCLKYKVKKLVYISSTGAIPEKPGNQLIKEVKYFEPEVVTGYYSVTKAEATQLVLDAVKKYPQLDASVIHPSGICGPNDYAYGPVSSFLIQYANGEMNTGIEGTFNSVDVRDLAEGVIACCDKGGRGECYIMANELVSMKEMFDIVNHAAGLTYKPKVLSVGVAKILAKIMAVISRINGKPALLTEFAIYNLSRNNNFSYEKAVKELGYQVRPFQETIADEVKWLKEEGKI
ncbi:epimerase [Anaerocolumna cellulosilytica]|uniref:Epimerase n=1 Tax=Anaerocolumna cellulosilytica TaxID=433286 RepID=A0A6S6QXY7_9FIRM|nr:NAD-dependent epimerase/dehydratase family protein [Anaerocolumna cellulosilytica]MBB5196666.1 dihydroflavonol-4-reductase [Anaerocolumna cellulosilytica]BCJ93929.1 epimerase [Anaerocolumna cellulosilytica]